MTVESALAFSGAVLLFAVIPGPAILACIAQALGANLRSALALGAGIVLGDLVFLLVAIYGLAVVASWLGGLFTVVRLIGGAYLVWLGWKSLSTEPTVEAAESGGRTDGHAFRAGLLITLGNPKVILFYLGFLPAFLDLSSLSGRDVLTVATLLVAVLMIVNATYAWMADRARSWVRSPAKTRRLHQAAGAVLAGAGIYVIAKP